MPPSILIAGATGNTGRSVTETLPQLLKASSTLSGYRIIAVTRSLDSPVARQLSAVPAVEVIEKNWVEITSDWLREHRVARAFIASHNEPNQFAEESTFHIAALNAGVQYVVRISTTAANVRPDCKAYYARTHWAVETLLASPEFVGLQWTSLQPNGFSPLWLSTAAEFIRKYRESGQQDVLKLMASEEAPVGIVDPYDVGVFASHLLSQDDPTPHNRAKYVLNGPEDITGKQIVDLVAQHIGTPVKEVRYKDLSFLDLFYDAQYATTRQSKNIIFSVKHALEMPWEGKCSVSTTSPEVIELAAPKRRPADVLKNLLEGH